MVKVGRRVVTGFDEEGKSIITLDGPVPQSSVGKSEGRLVNWMWRAKDVPSQISDVSDPMELFNAKRDWPEKEGYLIGIFKLIRESATLCTRRLASMWGSCCRVASSW